MTTTLSDGMATLTLPDGLVRMDPHSWSPVRQSVSPTIEGALWIDVSTLQAGEPITLAGGSSGDQVWGVMTRGEFAALRAMADQAGQVFTLTYLGEAIQVIWRHEDFPALDADAVVPFADPISTDLVVPTLKFTRIS